MPPIMSLPGGSRVDSCLSYRAWSCSGGGRACGEPPQCSWEALTLPQAGITAPRLPFPEPLLSWKAGCMVSQKSLGRPLGGQEAAGLQVTGIQEDSWGLGQDGESQHANLGSDSRRNFRD